MKPEEFREVMELEQGLKPGDRVIAYWTNCGNYYSAPAVVEKVNEKSVRVKLVDGYLAGRRITVPRITAIERWSWNNRIGSP